MRLAMVYLISSACLLAQAPLSGEVALKKFKQTLESLTKFARVTVNSTVTPDKPDRPVKTCAIPLLKVPAAPYSVDPQMAIVPQNKDRVHFHIVQVFPPAPSCDDVNVSWKE